MYLYGKGNKVPLFKHKFSNRQDYFTVSLNNSILHRTHGKENRTVYCTIISQRNHNRESILFHQTYHKLRHEYIDSWTDFYFATNHVSIVTHRYRSFVKPLNVAWEMLRNRLSCRDLK